MPAKTVPYNFCPRCAHPLQKSLIAGHQRSNCPECSYIHWGDFSLGVGGVLWHNNKVLLVQRAHNPGRGMWTIPGGYVDQDEAISTAVVREILEETGIEAKPLSIIALRDRPGERHDAYIIFLMQFIGGTLRAQPEEVKDLAFLSLEECLSLPIPALTMSALKASHSSAQGLTLNSEVDLIGKFSTLYQVPLA